MLVKLFHAHYEEEHLAAVIEEMKTLGAPTIKAIYDGEMYYAVEGCHRLRACEILGLTPGMEEVEEGETVTIGYRGFDEEFSFEELCDMVNDGRNVHIIKFEE